MKPGGTIRMTRMLKSMGLISLGISEQIKEVEVAVCIKDIITWFRVIDNPEPKDVECIRINVLPNKTQEACWYRDVPDC